jgi:hypothetical protein
MPCHWKGQSILVVGQIVIAPPYNVATPRTSPLNSSSSVSLPRVSKVLAGIREKLKL